MVMNKIEGGILLAALATQVILVGAGYRLNKWIFGDEPILAPPPPRHGHHQHHHGRTPQTLDPHHLATLHVLCDWFLMATLGLSFGWDFELWAAAFCLALALYVVLECRYQNKSQFFYHPLQALFGHTAWCALVFTSVVFFCWTYDAFGNSTKNNNNGRNNNSNSNANNANYTLWSTQKLTVIGAIITVVFGTAAIVTECQARRHHRQQIQSHVEGDGQPQDHSNNNDPNGGSEKDFVLMKNENATSV